MSKKKNYEVRILAVCSVVVMGAKNEEDALEIANDAAFFGDFEMDEAMVHRELKTPEELKTYRNHANRIVEEEE